MRLCSTPDCGRLVFDHQWIPEVFCSYCSRATEELLYDGPEPVEQTNTVGLGFIPSCGYCKPGTPLTPVAMGNPMDGGTYATGLLKCGQCRQEHQVMVYLRPVVRNAHDLHARGFREKSRAGACETP